MGRGVVDGWMKCKMKLSSASAGASGCQAELGNKLGVNWAKCSSNWDLDSLQSTSAIFIFKPLDTISNKAFIGLGSCDNVQTERSIFEYVNWPWLQI